ncbi:unnamed protein product [Nippostrongylus brasiliensis]|uniref:Uncharacterized protein n=1 Tax=Nippostrongylus brasiliensis TaxID=27835 RepID=A0A158QZA0_NIPBR|nr:unnamed protein product [Nippostrongylus brasiliensis]
MMVPRKIAPSSVGQNVSNPIVRRAVRCRASTLWSRCYVIIKFYAACILSPPTDCSTIKPSANVFIRPIPQAWESSRDVTAAITRVSLRVYSIDESTTTPGQSRSSAEHFLLSILSSYQPPDMLSRGGGGDEETFESVDWRRTTPPTRNLNGNGGSGGNQPMGREVELDD